MELTATEVLNRLKLVKKQIDDAGTKVLVGYLTTNDKNIVPAGFKTQEAFVSEAKARLDRVRDLVKFQQKLKKALVHSNATTQVQVGQKLMSVAEAIERKASIVYEKKICNGIKDVWQRISTDMDKINGLALETKADQFIAGLGKDVFETESARLDARKRFIEKNTAKYVGIDNPDKLVNDMEKEIHEFESAVDTSLSVINAKTIIKIDD